MRGTIDEIGTNPVGTLTPVVICPAGVLREISKCSTVVVSLTSVTLCLADSCQLMAVSSLFFRNAHHSEPVIEGSTDAPGHAGLLQGQTYG